MDLQNGEIHELNSNEMETYRKMYYHKHRIVMNTEGFDFERSSIGAFSRSDRELSAQSMIDIVDSLKRLNRIATTNALQLSTTQGLSESRLPADEFLDQEIAHQRSIAIALQRSRTTLNLIDNQIAFLSYNQKQIDEYSVEIHKKYAIPLACIVFIFVGAPLGIMARRGTFGIAATFSLGFFLLYWAALIGGEKLADRDIVEPWLGMWIANIILGILGIYLTIRMGRETPTINWNIFKRFVPKSYRPLESSDT